MNDQSVSVHTYDILYDDGDDDRMITNPGLRYSSIPKGIQYCTEQKRSTPITFHEYISRASRPVPHDATHASSVVNGCVHDLLHGYRDGRFAVDLDVGQLTEELCTIVPHEQACSICQAHSNAVSDFRVSREIDTPRHVSLPHRTGILMYEAPLSSFGRETLDNSGRFHTEHVL